MNIKILVVFLFIFFSYAVFGQSGNILKNQVFKSEVLSREVKYNIYLPPNYDESKEYPVFYWLHGFGGNNNSSLNLIPIIDSLLAANKLPELILVSPYGEKTWYIDDFSGRNKYSTMFIDEFVPLIEQTFPVSTQANKTIISGSSMGGFGALRFAMFYPDKFGVCVSFQAGMSTKEQIVSDPEADFKKYHQDLYGENLKPSERANEYFMQNNPLYIAQNLSAEKLQKVKWYIQCCDNDYHSLPNAELHIEFHKKGVLHEYRVNDGSHGGSCVKNNMVDALNFVNDLLRDSVKY